MTVIKCLNSFCVALATLTYGGMAARAQEGIVKTPMDDYHDERATALPIDYPARNYDAAQTLKALVQIASGSAPSREELEERFGLRFVKEPNGDSYAARGRKPLGDQLSIYSGQPSKEVSLTLHFDMRPMWGTNAKTVPRTPFLCLSGKDLVLALGNSWRVVEREEFLDDRRSVETSYAKEGGGLQRTIYIHPDTTGGPTNSQYGKCVDFVSIGFRRSAIDGAQKK